MSALFEELDQDQMSAALAKVMTEAKTADEAVRRIAFGANLSAEIRCIGPRLIADGEQAGEETARGLVMRFLADWGVSEEDAKALAAGVKLYVDRLSSLPAASIRFGMDKASASALSLPSPDQVYREGQVHANDVRALAYRAKKALDHVAQVVPAHKRLTKAEMIAAGLLDESGKVVWKKPEAPAPGDDEEEVV
jgi:hypothetical protein